MSAGLGLMVMLGGPGGAEGQDLRRVFERVNPAVVIVHTAQRIPDPSGFGDDAGNHALGSGVLVSADGLILTAAHVIQTADRLDVEFLGGERVGARVVAAAPFADVALLRLDRTPRGAVVATLADSDLSRPGEPIFVIGAPYGIGHALAVGWLAARRVVDDVIENLTRLEAFQIDAAIHTGNSGGPVFNLDGQVIALVSQVLMPIQGGAQGPAFAVTSNVARQLLLEQRRVWLGFETRLLNGPIAVAFNVPQEAALLVQSVAEGSMAERLGLHEGTLTITAGDQKMLVGGDVILSIMDKSVTSDPNVFAGIQQDLSRLRPGDELRLTILRAGHQLSLSAVVPDP